MKNGLGHCQIRDIVLSMKRTVSSVTGNPHTYAEIGRALGISAQGAAFYARNMPGTCPMCLRKLDRQTKQKK